MRCLVLVVGLLSACESYMTSVTFEFVHGSEKDAVTFRASATDPDLIERVRTELRKDAQDRSSHIHGKIGAGTGDNPPWHWHFERDEWDLVGISMELCDAQPSYVEENLEQWLKEVGSYCPWTSRVSNEL